MESDDREFAKTLQGGWICEPDPCKVRDARSCSCSRAAATINRLLDKLEAVSKEMASAKERMWETGHENERLQSRLDAALSAVVRFREDRERMLKRIEFASQPIGNCGYCLVGNKPGDHHLEDCPAYRAPVVERQPHEYAHTCTIQQGPCAACSYLDRIGV
jgi:hypothetical protein